MALHPLLESQYSQPTGFPQTYGVGSTYGLPLSYVIDRASRTSQRIPLQPLQDRSRGGCTDPSPMIMERSSSSEGRASFGPVKRSVPGMKSLMPLKLLSPRLPEVNIWPSPEPIKRSTFGTKFDSDDLEYSSDIGDRARDSLKSRKRSRRYRDTPIYSQAGSPIPSRAYFTDDDVSFPSSRPGSICDGDRVVQDLASLKEYEIEVSRDGAEDKDGEEDNTQRTPRTVRNLFQTPSALPTSRWSNSSFQCSGEALKMEESAWPRSPMRQNSSVEDDVTEDIEDDFSRRAVESWLSDTSSTFEHEEEIKEEMFAYATALSPARAQVVDLRISSNRFARLSPPMPARSSSLMETWMPANNFWDTLGTPPITPSGPWTGEVDMLSHLSQVNKDIHDIEVSVPSPPLSPLRLPTVVGRAAKVSPENRAAMRPSIYDIDSQWSLSQSQPSQPSIIDIVSSLEASTSNFPSAILLPDTPCIAAIRSRDLHHVSPIVPQHYRSASPLRSPFGHEFPLPPSYEATGKPKSSKFSTQHQDSSISNPSNNPPYSSSAIRSSSLPIVMSPSSLYPPDLTPLSRIFPRTSDFMRSVLYAHIIAHIFVTSLATTNRTSQSEHPSGRRRDSPHRPTSPVSQKAANILGIAFLDSDPTGDSAEKQLQFRLRLQALQQTLRQCIYCLTSVMDFNLGIDDVPELNDNGTDFNNGKLFIRTLEEVVRSCETGLYGLGGMV